MSLRLFEGYGIELEYMLVQVFQAEVGEVLRRVETCGGRLMPTAMHPWMRPRREARLWPHEYGAVYRAFDRIFGCRGHGWANLQSAHLNLPFGDALEFGRLHAAVRVVLPLIPALAASSPIEEGRVTGVLDRRLVHYLANCRRVPQVTAGGIPEAVFTPRDYESQVLRPLYAAIAPLDPSGVLQHEWLNARGAIARFDRSAIEIRLVDVQECPRMDLVLSAALAAVVRRLVESPRAARQRAWSQERLCALLEATIRDGERARIEDGEYLEVLGLPPRPAMSAGEVWSALLGDVEVHDPEALGLLHQEGPLARRILAACGTRPSRERLRRVYGRLCDCLEEGRPFVP